MVPPEKSQETGGLPSSVPPISMAAASLFTENAVRLAAETALTERRIPTHFLRGLLRPASSASVDLHDKFRTYRRNGTAEYLPSCSSRRRRDGQGSRDDAKTSPPIESGKRKRKAERKCGRKRYEKEPPP